MRETHRQLEEGLWDMIKSAGRFALSAASEVLLLKPLWRMLKGRITLTQARYIAEEAGAEIEQYVVRALKDDPKSFDVERDGDYYHVQFLFEINAKPVVRKVVRDLDLEQYQDTMKPEDFQKIVEVAIYEVTKERGFRGFLLNHLLHHQKRLLEREVGRLHAKTIRKYKKSLLKDPSDLLNSIENMAKGAYEVEVESKKKRDGTQVFVSFDLPYLKKHIRESIEMNDMGQLTEGSIRWNKVSMFSPEADYKKAEAALGENLAFMLQSIFERFSTMFGIEDMSKYEDSTRLFKKAANQMLASLTAMFSNSRGAIHASAKRRGVEASLFVSFDQMRILSEAAKALELKPDSQGKSMLLDALEDALAEAEEDPSFQKAILVSLLKAKEREFEESVKPQTEEWGAMNLDSPVDYDGLWESMAQNIQISDVDVDLRGSEVAIEVFLPGDATEDKGLDNLQIALESTKKPERDRLAEALQATPAEKLEEGWLTTGMKAAAATIAGIVAVKKVIMPAMKYFGIRKMAKETAEEAADTLEAIVHSAFSERKHIEETQIIPSGSKFWIEFVSEIKTDKIIEKVTEVLELDDDVDDRKVRKFIVKALEMTANEKDMRKLIEKAIQKHNRKGIKKAEKLYQKYIEEAEKVALDINTDVDVENMYDSFDVAYSNKVGLPTVEDEGRLIRFKFTKLLKPLS